MGSDDKVRTDPTLSKLRRLKPHHLVIELRDGTERKVAMPNAGNKWQRLSNVLDPLPWTCINAYDKDENLLGICEDEGGAEEADDDSGAPGCCPTCGQSVDITAVAKVMVGIVRDTMTETRKMFEAQITGNAEVIRGMAEASQQVSESYALAMRVQSAAQASQVGEGSPEVMQMLQLAMPMMMAQRSSKPAEQPRRTEPPRKPVPKVVDAEVKPNG